MKEDLKLQDEYVDGALIFYHSNNSLEAYRYLIDNIWRTTSGHYGHALYGNVDALWSANFTKNSPSTQNHLYGYGSKNHYRFRLRALRSHSLLFCDVEEGAKVLAGYSVEYAVQSLIDHGVPQDMIDSIRPLLEGRTYASNTVLKVKNNADPGVLLPYGYNGFVYEGNLDGKTVVYYNPAPSNVRMTGVSFDDGKTFMDIPRGTSWGQFQQLVKDYLNPPKTRRSTSQSASNLVSGSGGLVPKAILTYLGSKYDRLSEHFYRMTNLGNTFTNGGSLSTNDMIFVETWYYRYYGTSRRSVYGSKVSLVDYHNICLSAVIAASFCTDSVMPVDLVFDGSNINHKRALKLLVPYSLNNPTSYTAWVGAFVNLGADISFCPVVVSMKSTNALQALGRFISAGIVYERSYGFDLFAYWDKFAGVFEAAFGFKDINDYLPEFNSNLPKPFSLLASTVNYHLAKVRSVSSNGVVLM